MRAFVKIIAYIVSFFFLTTGTAIVLHPHDVPSELVGGTIHKVVNSSNRTAYNHKARNPLLAVPDDNIVCVSALQVTPEPTGYKAYRVPLFLAHSIYYNKAPPTHFI